MKKYLLTIEFRYKEIPKLDFHSGHKSNTITIGVFDSFETACVEGNKLLENLESKFPLHVFPNGRGPAKKERFSKNGGAFGSVKNLITNMAYLKTPFEFYAEIDTLNLDDVESTVNNILNLVDKYKEWALSK